jgi:branched-chain amino acid aminotransferase
VNQSAIPTEWCIDTHTDARAALAAYRLPARIDFGSVLAPVMVRADWRDGVWGRARLQAYAPLALDPAALCLHYAQEVFEGLKAYRVATPTPVIFRPDMNSARLNRSAERLSLPAVPEPMFRAALRAISAACAPFIPGASGQSLYLRPLLLGTQATLGVNPALEAVFLVIASPSAAYVTRPLKVVIERSATRAAAGGTGDVKAGGNYAAALLANAAARARGFDQVLWLDGGEHRYVEELTVMNVFAVIDGVLHTPSLTGTILPGVTRDSLLAIARRDGLTVHERRMGIDALLAAIRAGACTELFACGTAAIVASIAELADADGSRYELSQAPGPMAVRLRARLLDIQEGRAVDEFGWLDPVPLPESSDAGT